MKLKTHILFIVALQLASLMLLTGQDNPMLDYLAEVSGKYGRDADLVNGEKYFYP